MTGDCTDTVTFLKRGVKLEQLKAAMMSVSLAYANFLPIKAAKLKDVKALLQHIDLPPTVTFYQHLKGDDRVADDVNEYE